MPEDKERVVLVDEADTPIAVEEKMRAHRLGLLHRAFSVFIFNSRGQLLLQRRALGKYHSGGLWSNTCCGHPQADESVQSAAERRLFEEMGFTTRLRLEGAFCYRAPVTAELVEHEYDHLLVGEFEGDPIPDPAEVESWRWEGLRELREELQRLPDRFTCWFTPALEALRERRALPDR